MTVTVCNFLRQSVPLWRDCSQKPNYNTKLISDFDYLHDLKSYDLTFGLDLDKMLV